MARLNVSFLRAIDDNGDPVAGGKLYVYQAGTSTPVVTYSDVSLANAQAHPVIANDAGLFGSVYLPSGSYKVVVKGADDVTLYEADYVEVTSGNVSTITPADYGAAGDGVTDDGAAMAAFFAALPGNVGVLGAGKTYLCPRKLTITGGDWNIQANGATIDFSGIANGDGDTAGALIGQRGTAGSTIGISQISEYEASNNRTTLVVYCNAAHGLVFGDDAMISSSDKIDIGHNDENEKRGQFVRVQQVLTALIVTGNITVSPGETLTQAGSGATGVVVADTNLGDTTIFVSNVTGTFNTSGQLTGSTSGALGANSVPTFVGVDRAFSCNEPLYETLPTTPVLTPITWIENFAIQGRLVLKGPGRRPTDEGFIGWDMTYCRDFFIEEIETSRVDYQAIVRDNCRRGHIERMTCFFDLQGSSTAVQYGDTPKNATTDCGTGTLICHNGKHAFDWTRNTNPGIGRHFRIRHLIAYNTWEAGLAMHGNARDCSVGKAEFYNCLYGVNIRSTGWRVDHVHAEHCSEAVRLTDNPRGLWIGKVTGDDMTYGVRAVDADGWIGTIEAGDIEVGDVDVKNISGNAVNFDFSNLDVFSRERTLTLTSATTFAEGDVVVQASTNATGIVKTASTGTSLALYQTVGTFNTSDELFVNGVSKTASSVPASVGSVSGAVTGGTSTTITFADFSNAMYNASGALTGSQIVMVHAVGGTAQTRTITGHTYSGGVNTLTVSGWTSNPTTSSAYTIRTFIDGLRIGRVTAQNCTFAPVVLFGNFRDVRVSEIHVSHNIVTAQPCIWLRGNSRHYPRNVSIGRLEYTAMDGPLIDSRVQGVRIGGNFPTRNDAVEWIANGGTFREAEVFRADGLTYVYMPSGHRLYGTDPIPDMAGLVWGDRPTPYHMGAVGDYTTDDTTAMQAWLDSFSGTPLWIDAGVYRCTNRLTMPEGVIIEGVGGPRIAPFHQRGFEKDKLKPGVKGTLSGAVVIFDDTPSDAAFSTGRTDGRTDLNPCVIYNYQAGCVVSGFDIIQDMDVLTSGDVLTTSSNDNASTGYDCGVVQLGYGSRWNIGVFGYFPQGGFVNLAKVGDSISDPDYVDLSGSTISSGIVVIGASGLTPDGGNTGLKGTGVHVYGSDHHTRADTDPAVPALFVDGDTGGSNAGIRGISFSASNFRTYANTAIKLENCDDFTLIGCTTEFPALGGTTGLDASGKIVGTVDTSNVTLIGIAATGNLGLDELATEIKGKFFFSQAGTFDGTMMGRGGSGTAADVGAIRISTNSTDDPYIQFTSSLSSVTSGWQVLMDQSESDALDFRWSGGSVASLSTGGNLTVSGTVSGRSGTAFETCTLSSNEITVSNGVGWVDISNGGASGTLSTINGTFAKGDRLILQGLVAADVITLADGSGNIATHGSVNITLNGGFDWIELVYDGTRFRTTPLRDVS